MSSSAASSPRRDFVRVITDMALLDAEQARTIVEQATQRAVAPSQIAMQQGLLTAVQADIVETLLHPLECVPGYEILDVVGQGGMGVVFRARQGNLDRLVALKTVLVSRLADPAALSRFEQEAMAVARLQHPHIVAAYDLGRYAGRLYFAMEWLDGEDADRLIQRRGSLDEAFAWGLARQAAAGLAHAAEKGIVHRDIKPANLMLVAAPAGYPLPSGLPMVKIADFGVAFLTSQREHDTRLTADGSVVGSPYFLAPEQLRDDPVDFRADMYALGASVYHMLSGSPPFAGKSLGQILTEKIGAAAPNLRMARPDVSAATASLVERMMARDPADRPEDYRRLFEEIDAFIPAVPRAAAASLIALTLADTATIQVGRDATVAFERTSNVLPPARRSGMKRVVIALSTLLLLLVLTAVAWRMFGSNATSRDSPRRELVESGWEQPLFQGNSLNVWRNLTGVWKLSKDDEGGLVLAGENGSLPYDLQSVLVDRRPPPEHYRVTLHVRLHRATQLEVRFGYDRDANEFLSTRVTADSVQLGPGNRLGLSKPTASAAAGERDKFHVVQFERQRDAWWVFWDERLIAAVPFSGVEHRPEFRLVVESGPAWFSDVLFEELTDPSKP